MADPKDTQKKCELQLMEGYKTATSRFGKKTTGAHTTEHTFGRYLVWFGIS